MSKYESVSCWLSKAVGTPLFERHARGTRPTPAGQALARHAGKASTPAQLAAMRRGRIEVAIVATGDGLPAYDLEGLRLTALRSARW